ncbi:AAA family ATPase [Streptomyces sp. NPDC006643]|uniref:AAA family ATPase n=2 Tax=unclassified Streptomyces TaxID=2593676 RepID=UPI00368E9104
MTKTDTAHDTPWPVTATYPERPAGRQPGGRLAEFIDAMIAMGQTGQVFGEHGIGKTSTFLSHVPAAHPGTRVVLVPAANLTPDDLLMNAPVRDGGTGELVLTQLIMSQLDPGEPFVLLIDDSLQAGQTIQSQLMQIACNWTLGEHDLRALGCVGVFLSDNESLTETGSARSDLAVLDRMVTLRLTANDTAWRHTLAARYADWDLAEVFRIWAALPPRLRALLSPRTLEHVLDCARAGLPLSWGLPLVGGVRLALRDQRKDGAEGADRTAEVLDAVAGAVGVANPRTVADPVRRILRTALRENWAVLLQGPPGCGKTEITKSVVREELGAEPVYFSLPVTNVEDLCVPVPTPDGRLDTLLTRALSGPGEKVIVWDEYNRPKDKAAFAKLMEITQEWSLAGRPVEGLRAQIALQNPPYHLGRKLQVSRNNVAQASRFTVSYEVRPEDIPANEWLIAAYGEVAETVLEWWKNDIDDEARDWITKRTLERLIKLRLAGQPLMSGLIYLGDGEFAPVPLTALEARLDGMGQEVALGFKELVRDVDLWEKRLAVASEISSEGTNDTDVVHRVLANAELSQLKRHPEVVARVLRLLPPKLRATYLVGQTPARQSYWVGALARMKQLAASS